MTRTEKSLVAIARALAADAEMLVLDEPTASLPADEVQRLFDALRRLRQHDVGMIYVSHRLDEVFAIADRMIVLRDGRVAGERVVAETSPEETDPPDRGPGAVPGLPAPPERRGAARLRVDRLRVGTVGPISCEVHAGEIVGLVGLRGAGQEAVGRTLFGLRRPSAGRIVIDGADTLVSSPRAAMEAGVNLVCGDRVGESILPSLAVRENMFLNPRRPARHRWPGSIPGPRRGGPAPRGAGRPASQRSEARHRAPVGRQPAEGRGRPLARPEREDLRFEDPTAGVDVGAKAEIYRLFDVALQAGAAIIIVSTDFEEVAKVCHRAIVFDRGAVVNELAAEDLSIGNLLAAASANIPRKYPTEAVPGSASGAPHAVH